MPFPLNLVANFGSTTAFIIYALLGFAFGFVLESAGFGNSKKLAAQFYFKELTVLKVMFTAIIVAMVLIFLSSALGLLDYNLIWVNPTYVWSGILGGLIMGVGFIIGGFCPGTSLVAAATLKIDGLFFVAGALFGIFIFGDSIDYFSTFFHGSYLGRVTLPDLLLLPTGIIVVLIISMAIAIFAGAEWIERKSIRVPMWQRVSTMALFATAVFTAALGQPNLNDRWNLISAEQEPKIQAREIFASPLEVANLQNNREIIVKILDVRSETDYNFFHIRDSTHIEEKPTATLANDLIAAPENTVFIVTSNDEDNALSVWKTLKAASVPNIYVLDGGINGWIRQFAHNDFLAKNAVNSETPEILDFSFPQALGHRYSMAAPNTAQYSEAYEIKVKLETKRAPSGGGCG